MVDDRGARPGRVDVSALGPTTLTEPNELSGHGSLTAVGVGYTIPPLGYGYEAVA